MMGALWIAFCAAVVAVVCWIFVFHKEYEDGLFGRIGLIVMAFASMARVAALVEADFVMPFNPIAAALWTGLALFLGRQLWRFLRLHRHPDDWRKPNAATTGGKHPRKVGEQ